MARPGGADHRSLRERRLPVGDDGFARGQSRSVLVDKTMLIADVIDGGATCTLPCRPRRFGKTLNKTTLKSFFEIPAGRFSGEAMMGSFRVEVWDTDEGGYRAYQGCVSGCVL